MRVRVCASCCRAPRADLKPRDNEVLLNILRCSFRGGGANLSHELPRYSDVVNGRVVWDAASINDRIPIAFEAWVTCCTLFSVTAGFGTCSAAHCCMRLPPVFLRATRTWIRAARALVRKRVVCTLA